MITLLATENIKSKYLRDNRWDIFDRLVKVLEEKLGKKLNMDKFINALFENGVRPISELEKGKRSVPGNGVQPI